MDVGRVLATASGSRAETSSGCNVRVGANFEADRLNRLSDRSICWNFDWGGNGLSNRSSYWRTYWRFVPPRPGAESIGL